MLLSNFVWTIVTVFLYVLEIQIRLCEMWQQDC